MSSRPPPRGRGRGFFLMQNTSLRGVVIAIGLMIALWSLLWGIGSFRTISTDKSEGQTKLASLAIILGVIYMAACVIAILGVIAACIINTFMLRLYTLLSVVSSFAVVGAALMRVIVHFLLKTDLIDECEKIVQGSTVYSQFGFWGPTYETHLTSGEATFYCNSAFNHDSWVEIIMLIVELLLAIFFTSIAFAYYRQVLDPTSPANAARRAPPAGDAYPAHYNPPYLAYDPAQAYAPPPGEPPAPYDPAKPPSYEYDAGYGAKDAGYAKDVEEGAGKAEDPFADFERGDAVQMPKPGVEDPFEDFEHRGEHRGSSEGLV